MKTTKQYICIACLILTLSLLSIPSSADVISLTKLRFGKFIVAENNNKQSVTVNLDGSYNFSSSLIMIDPPQRGEYQIHDLAPNSTLHLDVSQIQPLSATGNFFILKNFENFHTNSDNNGVANLILGATAESSGNGLPYRDQTYSGTIQILISY